MAAAGPALRLPAGTRVAQASATQSAEEPPPTTAAEPPKSEAKEPAAGDSDEVDLAAANQVLANPLAQATLLIVENDTVTLGGKLSDGSRRANVTVIEPVIPVSLGNTGWSLVNRPILPIAFGADVPVAGGGGGPTAPATEPGIEFNGKNGLGDFTFFSMLTPTKGDSHFKWGLGPIFRFPTATQDELGQKKYSIGPAAVGLYSSQTLTFGALNKNLFSIAGDSDRSDVCQSTLQYFVFYNFTPKWGFGTAPIISVNWDDAGNDNGWSVPIGVGITRTFTIGKIPARLLLEGQHYVVQRDDYGPKWNLRLAFGMFLPSF